MQFDIENVCPSRTSDLLYNSIQFVNEVLAVSDNGIHIIMQSRKTVLFNEKIPWVKRCGDEDLDVSMGYYNEAEVLELVRSFLLRKVSNTVDKKSSGLYRDDALAILQNLSGPEIKSKDIIKMFKTAGLNITIQAGLRIVNFLAVQFNLNSGTYQPYRKPDNTLVVLKQLPKLIAKRISDISSDENIFCNSIPLYSEAHKKVVLMANEHIVEKQQTVKPQERKSAKEKLYAPFSLYVKTNVRKIFLRLVKRHFPKENPLNKLFNKNTLKVATGAWVI